jgi:hypothetical protein
MQREAIERRNAYIEKSKTSVEAWTVLMTIRLSSFIVLIVIVTSVFGMV